MGDWCTWKFGNERKVLIGVDYWCGANKSSKISYNLIQIHRSKCLINLNDGFSTPTDNNSGGWKQAQGIGLSNDLDLECNLF